MSILEKIRNFVGGRTRKRRTKSVKSRRKSRRKSRGKTRKKTRRKRRKRQKGGS